MSLLDSLLGGYVYVQEQGSPAAAPARKTLVFSGATVTDDGPTANSTTILISGGGGGSFPGGDLCSGTGTTVTVSTGLSLAGGMLTAPSPFVFSSSQLTAGDGSAVTVGSGLSLAGGTITASGGGGISTGLDIDRPSPALVTVGTQYLATDSGVLYVCDSASSWAVVGMGGGSDTVTLGGFNNDRWLGTPDIGNFSGNYDCTWVVNFYVTTTAGFEMLWINTDGSASTGWAFSSTRTSSNCLSAKFCGANGGGTGGDLDLPGATIPNGAHTLALTLRADNSVRYAYDGVLQTPTSVSGTALSAGSGTSMNIGHWTYGGYFGLYFAEMGYVQAFASPLSDADLQTLSSNPSQHRPQKITTNSDFTWCTRWYQNMQGGMLPVATSPKQLNIKGSTGIMQKTYR